MTQRRGIFTYENGLLLLLGFSFGVAFFDRTAGPVLVPYINKDIPLTQTQISLISSSLSFAWAIGAYVIARWSDARGSRKPFLLAFLIIFSACSFLAGFAPSFGVLVLSRFIMGLVEGPFLPVCLAIMMMESSEHRRGVNAGVMQNFFAAILGQTVTPLLLGAVAGALGWRAAFFIAGVPGLLCALAVMFWVREPPKPAAVAPAARSAESADQPTMGLLAMVRVRNIALCCAISTFLVGWMILGWAFFPYYFADVLHLPPATAGFLLSTLGIASAVSGFGAPALSDRIGRKPVMIAFCLAGVITPLAVLYFQGPPMMLAALMFIGWTATGAFPLFMGVIPSESIGRKYAASAMGLVVCVGEILGGTAIVSAAGPLADRWGTDVALFIQVGCAVIGGLLCLFLVETAPAKLRAAAAQTAIAKAA
jgi:MFS family permease